MTAVHRFWTSWYSDQPLNMETPYTWWDAGHRSFAPRDIYVAVLDADCEESVWRIVDQYFPDNERRFISEKEADWQPSSGRFPQ